MSQVKSLGFFQTKYYRVTFSLPKVHPAICSSLHDEVSADGLTWMCNWLHNGVTWEAHLRFKTLGDTSALLYSKDHFWVGWPRQTVHKITLNGAETGVTFYTCESPLGDLFPVPQAQGETPLKTCSGKPSDISLEVERLVTSTLQKQADIKSQLESLPLVGALDLIGKVCQKATELQEETHLSALFALAQFKDTEAYRKIKENYDAIDSLLQRTRPWASFLEKLHKNDLGITEQSEALDERGVRDRILAQRCANRPRETSQVVPGLKPGQFSSPFSQIATQTPEALAISGVPSPAQEEYYRARQDEI